MYYQNLEIALEMSKTPCFGHIVPAFILFIYLFFISGSRPIETHTIHGYI